MMTVLVMMSLIAFIAAGIGCESVGSLLSGMDKPTARIRGVQIKQFDLQGATLAFDVEVKNPYATPLPLVDLNYVLSSGGTNFLNGEADVAGTVPAKGSKRLTLPASVSFSNLLGVLQGVKPGSVVPYEAALDLGVDAPGVGRLALPIRRAGELPVPTAPTVELSSVKWNELTFNRAQAELAMTITNHNAFPVELSNLNYGLSLGGVRIAETGIDQAAALNANKPATLRIPITIRPSSLGLAAFQILTGQEASYSLDGVMGLDTPFGALNVPFERSGQTTFRR